MENRLYGILLSFVSVKIVIIIILYCIINRMYGDHQAESDFMFWDTFSFINPLHLLLWFRAHVFKVYWGRSSLVWTMKLMWNWQYLIIFRLWNINFSWLKLMQLKIQSKLQSFSVNCLYQHALTFIELLSDSVWWNVGHAGPSFSLLTYSWLTPFLHPQLTGVHGLVLHCHYQQL